MNVAVEISRQIGRQVIGDAGKLQQAASERIILGLPQTGDALTRGGFHLLEDAFLPQKVVKTPSIHGVFFFHGMVEVEKSDFKACGLAITLPY